MNQILNLDMPDLKSLQLTEPPKVRLDSAVLGDLSQLRPWRSLLQIALEWAGFLVVAVCCHTWFHPAFYVPAVLWIGARQHALIMLLHEGIHYRLARNRSVNYWVSELFTAWPLLITFHGYQRDHLAHHRWLGTAQDPDLKLTRSSDYTFPKSRWGFFWAFLKHALGFNTLRDYFHYLYEAGFACRLPLKVNLFRGLFYFSAGSALFYFDLWQEYLVYWLVPALTSLVFFLYFRLVSEHYGLDEGVFMLSRNVFPSFLEKLFFGPVNIHYHLDHHLFPSVPFYNLPELHAELEEDPYYRTHAHRTDGYLAGVVDECVGSDAESINEEAALCSR